MKLTLKRFIRTPVTFGKLTIEGVAHPDIYSIELPWINNVHNISCIPCGLYNFISFKSPSKGDVWKVLSVPERQDILIHVGNYASEARVGNIVHRPDTLGCILLGFGIDEAIPMVQRSRDCIKYLHEIGMKEGSILIEDELC